MLAERGRDSQVAGRSSDRKAARQPVAEWGHSCSPTHSGAMAGATWLQAHGLELKRHHLSSIKERGSLDPKPKQRRLNGQVSPTNRLFTPTSPGTVFILATDQSPMKSAHSFKLCLLLDKGLVAWMERGLHCDLMSPTPRPASSLE